MKKTATLILLIILLALLIINFFNFLIFPNDTLKKYNNLSNLENTYEINTVISISSERNDDFYDISLQTNEIVDPILNEYYTKSDLTLGENTYKWEDFIKFNSLTTNNTFENKTIFFENINLYNLENPLNNKYIIGKEITNDLLNIDKKYIQKTLISYSDNTKDKSFKLGKTLKYNIETNEKSLFDNFKTKLLNSAEYNNFFEETKQIEKKLSFKENSTELNNLFQNILNNSEASNANIIYNINKDGITSIEVDFKLNYNKNMPLKFKIVQTYKYNQTIENIDNILIINSLTNIDELKPTIYKENEIIIGDKVENNDAEHSLSELEGIISFDNITIHTPEKEDEEEIKEAIINNSTNEEISENISEDNINEQIDKVLNQ